MHEKFRSGVCFAKSLVHLPCRFLGAALVDGRCGDVGMESFVRCPAGSGVVAIIEKNICNRLECDLKFVCFLKRLLGKMS